MPPGTFFHPNRLEDNKEEKQEEKKEEKQEVKKEEKQMKIQQQQEQTKKESLTLPPVNLLSTVFRLRQDLHRAEEQRARVRRGRGVKKTQYKKEFSTSSPFD